MEGLMRGFTRQRPIRFFLAVQVLTRRAPRLLNHDRSSERRPMKLKRAIVLGLLMIFSVAGMAMGGQNNNRRENRRERRENNQMQNGNRGDRHRGRWARRHRRRHRRRGMRM